MWQKNSVSTISELIAQRPGADFELEDYMLLPAEKLPVISNLSFPYISKLFLLVYCIQRVGPTFNNVLRNF